MICIKLNTDKETALKALNFLKNKDCKSLGVESNTTCVVYWSDGTFSGETEHEGDSFLADKTYIFETLENFIESVKQS